MKPDYDVLIIGSGFGGSVSALRLTEKGYRVGVLEAGRRFSDEEFAKTSWDLRKFLWAPKLGCYGIQRIHPLRNVMILAGAGVGGGSLNYANTLVRAAGAVLRRPAVVAHHRLAQRAGAALRPGAADAGRGIQPDLHRRGPHRQRGRRRDGLRRHVRADPGRGVLRPRRHPGAGQDRARPVFRRRGPGAHRVPGMRLLHDGLPLRRQEHAGEELSWPRGIGRRTSDSDDDGERFRAAVRRVVGGSYRSHRQLAAQGHAHVHRHAPDPGRGHLGNAASAVQDARQGPAASPFETVGCA